MKRMFTAVFAAALVVMTVAGVSLFADAQASADDDRRERKGRVRVTGSYDAVFTQFEFFGFSDGFAHLNAEFNGPFQLNVGGEARTGTIVWTGIGKLAPTEGNNELFGAAVWSFDEGPICAGQLSSALVGSDGHEGIDTRSSFECTDGSTLRVRIVETAGPPTPHAEVSGVMVPAGPDRDRGDDDDGEDDD